jgi:hypothetical protein
MIAKAFLSLAAGAALASALLSPAMAKLATTADLSGRKICWGNGDTMTFSPGGKFSSTQYGDGTWAVTAVGVQLHAAHIHFTQWDIEKLPDGTFTRTDGYADSEATGKYCN